MGRFDYCCAYFVEQELSALLENISFFPVFVGFVLLDLGFMCMFCRSLFVLFLLAIVLSVHLRFTDSDYLFWYLQTFLVKAADSVLYLYCVV